MKIRPPIEVSSRTRVALKPVRGYEIPAVSPPYLRGANVLYDPGFEGFVKGTYGVKVADRELHTGSDMYTVPFYSSTCGSGSQWPDSSCNTQFSGWVQRNGTYVVGDAPSDMAWKMSNASPRSGTWGAVWFDWQAESSFNHPALLMVQGFNHPAGVSARCESGDTITWSTYAKASSTTGTPQVVLWVTFYTSGVAALISNTQTSNLTTSYAQYSMSVGAPSNSHYVRVMFDWAGTGASRTITYVDDAALGVQ
jgi:hypothetical protein